MKLGIFGGTFNPPHLGHLTSARLALDALGLDELRFVPAALPPHKRLPPDAPGPEARLEMVELAADGLLLPGRVSVSDMELSRPGKSYTADTLEQLHAQNPGAELWLMMGTDMFLTLQNWREPERITALAGICAFARTQADCGELLTIQAEHLRKTFGAKVCVLQLPQVVDVSSTRLRELLARGEGWEYLSPAVYGYILRHGLYGAGRDLKRLPDRELRACSYSMIRAKRIAHVKGTEEEAVRLAGRRRVARPPGGDPPRLHQVFGTGRAVAIMREIWYRTGRIGAAGRQAPPLQDGRVCGPARVRGERRHLRGHFLAHHRKGRHDPAGEAPLCRRLHGAHPGLSGGGAPAGAGL